MLIQSADIHYPDPYSISGNGGLQSFPHFSESEAPDPLRLSLQYFFEKEQNRYEFSTAFLRFTKISNESMITARRFYNIVKDTS